MTTPDERFLLAEDTCGLIKALAKNLKTIGIYNEVEYKAVNQIFSSVGLAMNILDPEKYEQYLEQVKREFEQKAEAPAAEEEKPVGQYL